jgi:alpha-amylase
VQLTATVKPDNATDRKVAWTSSDSSVANVMGTGVVTAGSKAGKATVTATAGGVSASVEVTVEAVGKQPMTVWYKPDSSWKTVKANYRVYSTPQSAAHGVELKAACGGWYKLTVPDTKGAEVSIAFTNGSKWDSNGGKNYIGSGTVMAVSDGGISFKTPDCPVVKPMTVWYKPDSSWKTVKANYRVYSAVQKTGYGVVLEKSCGGWYSLTVPDTEGARVSIAFTNGSMWDSNGGKNYIAAGDTMAVSGGQVVPDVTPNCAVTNKQ